MSDDRMRILLRAARRAATDPEHVRPMAGALLHALEDLGWGLYPVAETELLIQRAREGVIDDRAIEAYEKATSAVT